MNAITRQETSVQHERQAELLEQVIIGGDLSLMSAQQRINYYRTVCDSVGLNPYTKPLEYIKLNNKLTLYARRDATDQLRSIHGISLSKPRIEYIDDLIVVTIEAIDRQGRTDTDLGAVNAKGLQGEAKANALLKAITKAKRRVTLSLAGLGWLDESEVDSVPDAQRIMVDSNTGEILEPAKPANDLDPTDEEMEIIAKWANRTEAEIWAVQNGACANEYESRNSMEKSIKHCGGTVTKDNYIHVYTHFLRRQMEKLNEMAEDAVEQAELEPEVAF